jgi:hypothetical protein
MEPEAGLIPTQLVEKVEWWGIIQLIGGRMMYRATKFVSAISAGVVVSVPFAAIPVKTIEAAEECLAKPKQLTPPGQHWYYIVEHSSNRHCWHLQPETAAHAAISRRARRAALVESRKNEPEKTSATMDAYAEFGLSPSRADNAPQDSQQTLVASDYPKGAGQDQPDSVSGASSQSLVAARWPEPAGIRSAAIEPPPPASFAVAMITPDETPDASTTEVTAKASPIVLTSAETPATGTSASLETLLIATIGAMTLTGLAGSSVYLLARVRRRPQAHAGLAGESGWPPPDPVDHTRLPRWLDPAASGSKRYRERAHDVEF